MWYHGRMTENLEAIALAAYGGRNPGRMKADITRRIGIKRCSSCREWLRVDSFGADKSRVDGLAPRCRECASSYLREWHARPGREGRHAEYTRRSRYGTEEARKRTAEARHRDRCRVFGITPEDYARMYEDQGGVCAMCGKTEEENGKRLAIDHDHRCCPADGSRVGEVCGKCVRGLLCSTCNIAVGYFENKAMVEKCRAYVEGGRG